MGARDGNAETTIADGHPYTATVGQLKAWLATQADDRPVIVGTAEWYLNVTGVSETSDDEAYALVVETRDDFDTRQF
jgi:hypothetical protein